MKRSLTRPQAAELLRAASVLPPGQRDAFLRAVDSRLVEIHHRLTDDDVAAAIVTVLGDASITTTHCFVCDAAPTEEADMARPYLKFDIRTGRPIEDDDGVLRDGQRISVPLMMRDAMSPLQRAIAEDKAVRRGFDDFAARHRPGPVYADRSAAREVWEDERRAAQDAWRNPAPDAVRGQQPGDLCTINGAPGHLNDRLMCVPDATDRRRKRKGVSRDPFGRELETWEEEEEDSAPAVLPPRTMDAAEARRIKQEAYDAMCAEDRDAWRKPLP